MNFVKIHHYVENSFAGRPSFIIEMSDGYNYISNGCVFIRDTPENQGALIAEHQCSQELDTLHQAPAMSIEELTNGSWMFYGTKLKTFDQALPNLTNGSWMFYGTKLKTFDQALPNLTNGSHMFCGTNLETFDQALPNLTNGSHMFYGTSCENVIQY